MQFGMMDNSGMMSGGSLIWEILEWIFGLLILIGLVLLIKYLWEGGGARKEQESALEILKKRYARGEISKEEFDERKKDLI